jgi:ribonuclease VapC
MILDSSALIAILRAEPDAAIFAAAIEGATHRRISAVTYAEASAVIDRSRDPVAGRRFDQLLRDMQATIEPVTISQADIARQAYRDFGKGSRHRAKLNLGDCFAYALAKETGESLLYNGDDFCHTDVTAAIPRSR